MCMDGTSHTEAGPPVLCPQARFLTPTMNPVWKGWEDKWGWWRAYRFSEMDDSLWAGKTAQSNLQSRQTTHFLLCPLCTLHQMFYGIKPDPGRPVAPFCTPRASYQHVYHTTLCGKRMFTLATQYLQFLCWKGDSGPILQIYLRS